MILSLFGEIGLCLCGLLYVMDKWFNSFIDLMELMKDKDEDKDDDKQEMSETMRHMYS